MGWSCWDYEREGVNYSKETKCEQTKEIYSRCWTLEYHDHILKVKIV